jgi:hypothetical protein
LILVDPDFPDVWQREPHYSKLLKFARLGNFVGMRIGLRCIELGPDGFEREVRHSQAHIEGRERDIFTSHSEPFRPWIAANIAKLPELLNKP